MNTEADPPPRRTAPEFSRTSKPAGGSRSLCEIALQNPCRYPEASARRWRPWLTTVVGELAPTAGSLAVRFVSDREMQRLNREYRHRDKPTDVLSFPGQGEPEGDPIPAAVLTDAHLGDIAIAIPTARRQAAELGHSVERELRVLLLHGVLHCLGYDHETDDGTMDLVEHRWRSIFVDGDGADV